MSPASSGALEVEKYIGACLISQSGHKSPNTNSRDVYYSRERYAPEVYPGSYPNFDNRYQVQRCNSVDMWAGGMPLISFANYQRRGRRPDQQNDVKSSSTRYEDNPNPLARLAVHTQGAPLILTKSFNYRKNKQKNAPASKPTKNSNNKSIINDSQNTGCAVDTVSVTSDESSGSTNSDVYLPRIIKPRKRRKKDRKPTLLGQPLNQDGFSTDSASPELDVDKTKALRSYMPFVFDQRTCRLVPEGVVLLGNKPRFDDYDKFNDVSETPKLHHSFEDVEELDEGVDINGNQPTTTCQCRYCDPSGQIWDVDRSCYSPFLTAPVQLPHLKTERLLPRYNMSTDYEDNSLIYNMASVSLTDGKGQKSVDPKKASLSSNGDLEVSSQIVPFLNGHRDIEIKFFSSTSADNDRISQKPDNFVNDLYNKTCVKSISEHYRNRCVNNGCKFNLEK